MEYQKITSSQASKNSQQNYLDTVTNEHNTWNVERITLKIRR